MRTCIAAALAALLAACGGSSSASLETQAKNALPRSENMQMGSPSASSNSKDGSDGTLQQNSTVGDASVYFSTTVGLATIVNGGTAVTLGVVKTITDFPATNCTADTCTWGPGSSALDANNFKLVVTRKTNPDRFEYELSGEPKTKPGSGYIVFLSGTAIPSGTPHVGSGEVIIDFDAHSKLDNGGTDTGKLDIHYSNTNLLSVSASATGVKDSGNPGQKLNVAYQYANNADGGGDLDAAFRNTTSNNTLSLHSRWKATGAGRGDVKITLNGGTALTASECWSAASGGFKVVYFIDVTGASGQESACAFSPAVFGTQTPPQ
jgi:hypothetical protein